MQETPSVLGNPGRLSRRFLDIPLLGCLFFFYYYRYSFLFNFYLFTFRERGREGETEGEKPECIRDTLVGCFSHAPNWGPGPQPRLVS